MAKIDLSQVEWYSRSRGPAMIGPTVVVNKGGKTILNEEALALIGHPEAVQVGVLQGTRSKVTLVLQAAARGDSGALTLSKQGKSKRSVNTTKFLRDRGLDKLFGTVEATPELDEETDTLIVTV